MQKKINMSELNNDINVYYTNEKVYLPKDYHDEVEAHWNSLLKDGKNFFRGDVYTITNIECNADCINIYVNLTDYAHFLYTIHKNNYTEYDCRVIHTSVLIETIDKRFVIGVMNVKTASPNKLQFIGGGIDKNDIKGNKIDLEHNIRKEIYEEIGIDIENKSIIKELKPYLLKSGGDNNFLSAIFKLELLINENELIDFFDNYSHQLINQDISPEISSLAFIQSDKRSVEDFIYNDVREKDSNIIPTLEVSSGISQIEKFCDLRLKI